MHSTKQPGFTFVEAMISIAILGIIAVAAFYSLRTARMTDELRSGARVVAADLRAIQARALQGQNLKWCPNASAQYVVCEDNTALCNNPAQCTAFPSGGYGAHLYKDSNVYRLYAKYDNNTTDWRKVTDDEVFLTRDLAKSGAMNVTVSDLQAAVPFTEVDVAFMRQSGQMRINSCGACAEQSFLNVTLKHTISLKTIVVSLNYTTGRISIEE